MKSISIKQFSAIGAALLLAGLTGEVVAGDVQGGMRDVNQVYGRSSAMSAPAGSVKVDGLTVETIGRAPKANGTATHKQVAHSYEGLIGDFGRGTPNLAIIHKGASNETLAADVR
jgi:hypothetical protein